MVEIYYDPYADAIREMARICAVLVERGAPARERALARSILDKLTDGTALSGDERRALARLRASYDGAQARNGSPARAGGRPPTRRRRRSAGRTRAERSGSPTPPPIRPWRRSEAPARGL